MVIALITALVFLGDIVLMLALKLQGGDATALVGGSALVVLIIAARRGSRSRSRPGGGRGIP